MESITGEVLLSLVGESAVANNGGVADIEEGPAELAADARIKGGVLAKDRDRDREVAASPDRRRSVVVTCSGVNEYVLMCDSVV